MRVKSSNYFSNECEVEQTSVIQLQSWDGILCENWIPKMMLLNVIYTCICIVTIRILGLLRPAHIWHGLVYYLPTNVDRYSLPFDWKLFIYRSCSICYPHPRCHALCVNLNDLVSCQEIGKWCHRIYARQPTNSGKKLIYGSFVQIPSAYQAKSQCTQTYKCWFLGPSGKCENAITRKNFISCQRNSNWWQTVTKTLAREPPKW